MITEITNNPFRILGLPANATREEIDLCYSELTEGLKQQGQTDEFIKEIENAYQAIISPEYHWPYALFGFVSLSDKDDHAIQYVDEGLYEAAIEVWEERTDFVSTHNIMLCSILMGEDAITHYGKVFYYARRFFAIESEFNQFAECVGESDKTAAEAARFFLDTIFSQTAAQKATLYALLGNKEWMGYVRGKWVQADEADASFENMMNYAKSSEQIKK